MKTYPLYLAPVALLGSALAPALASAQAFDVAQVVVNYADLDLTTRSGVVRLDHRIRNAVEIVCGPISAVDHAGKNDVRVCRAETLALARAHRDTAIARYRQSQKIEISSRE